MVETLLSLSSIQVKTDSKDMKWLDTNIYNTKGVDPGAAGMQVKTIVF